VLVEIGAIDKAGLASFALDVVFARRRKAAEGLHAVGGMRRHVALI
jgi:hypothetical protein